MKTNGPWKIKSSENKYTNPWISVREDQVIHPNGKDGIFGIVEMIDGISVLPGDNDGYVYLTKEYHYASQDDNLEVMSGAIDKGESILEAAKRELKEETGIIANKWIKLGTIEPFTTVVKSEATLYLAQDLNFQTSNTDGSEIIEVHKVKLEDAIKMVMNGDITHGPSCTLILKANIYLNNNFKLAPNHCENN